MPRIASIGGTVNGTGIAITNRRPLGSSTPTPTPAPSPTVSISAAQSQAEGNSGTKTWTYTISRSASAGAVTVNVNFSAGGTNASDWQGGVLPSGLSVNMANGVSSANLVLTSVGDVAVEGDESFTLQLVAPSGYTLGSPNSATGTITNDDTTPSINTVVIEGDSITSGAPSTPDGSYAYQYDSYRTDKTIEVRGQNSRSIGGTGNLNDNSNTLFGNVAEDAAYAPDLLTMMIGANDFTGITDATYRSFLTDLRAAYSSARSAMKVAWSPPIAYNPTGTPHGSKTDFDARRASLLADCRNPTVWGQWADYYLPMGEHPDFGDATVAAPLFGDSVHPNATGQAALYSVFKPALDSILDASRTTSTTMLDALWPANETNLAVGQRIRRRIIVSGLAHTGTALGASISGAGNPQIRVGGRAWGTTVGTGSGNGYRLYNGDVIEYELDLSSSNSTARSVDITIGSETRTRSYTTVAAVTPATYAHGGFSQRTPGGTDVHTVAAVEFPFAGTGVIAVQNGTGPSDPPSGVTWNGVAATQIGAMETWSSFSLWRVPVTAGVSANVVITYPVPQVDSVIAWGTVRNADAVPVASDIVNVGIDAAPSYPSPSVTVPASGIAIAFQGDDGNAPLELATVTTGTQVVSDRGGTTNGGQQSIVGGTRTTSGSIVFNGRYGGKITAIAVFKAAGT